MKTVWNLLALAIIAVLVGFADKGLAQIGGPMGGMGGRPPLDRPDERSREPVMASGAHLIANMEQQLDDVRIQLKLRPDQEAVWVAYQEKVGALVADQLRPATSTASGTGDALHQIDRKIDVVRNRLAAMEDIGDAARRFYAKLDDRQRDIADRVLATTVPALYTGVDAERPVGPGKRPGRPGPGSMGMPPD